MDRDARTQLNEHRVIESRRALAQDLEALIYKMNPLHAVHEAKTAAKEAIGMSANTHESGAVPVVRTILGLAAVGYGVRQLAGSGMPQRIAAQIEPHLPIDHRGHVHATGTSSYSTNGNGGGGLKSKASDLGSTAQDKAGDVRDQVAGAFGGVTDKVGDTVGDVKDQAQMTAMRVQDAVPSRSEVVRVAKQNPMLLGVGALFLGALAGALAPRTSFEEEKIAQAQDMVVEQGKELADVATTAIKSAAEAGLDAAKETGKETVTEELGSGTDEGGESGGGSVGSVGGAGISSTGINQANRITSSKSSTSPVDIH